MLGPTKDIQHLALTGELWCFLVNISEKIDCTTTAPHCITIDRTGLRNTNVYILFFHSSRLLLCYGFVCGYVIILSRNILISYFYLPFFTSQIVLYLYQAPVSTLFPQTWSWLFQSYSCLDSRSLFIEMLEVFWYVYPNVSKAFLYDVSKIDWSWWRHQMETFSALLAICGENSPVPGEFPAQWPVTRNFDVCFWSAPE